MTSSLAKSKQIIGAQFQRLFFYSFLIVWCSWIFKYIWLSSYIKDTRLAVYFNNQKIIAYHL